MLTRNQQPRLQNPSFGLNLKEKRTGAYYALSRFAKFPSARRWK
ncbi:MAG: hypothetical protein ACI9ZD_001178, partial [Paracoccaceae bacterium]